MSHGLEVNARTIKVMTVKNGDQAESDITVRGTAALEEAQTFTYLGAKIIKSRLAMGMQAFITMKRLWKGEDKRTQGYALVCFQ